MKKMTLLLLLLCSYVMLWSQSVEVSIPFKDYQYVVKGTFLKAPKFNGTVVLIIAGSGPTDRDCNNVQMQSNAYKFLAEHFAQHGISSLRYDKLGIAESTPGIPEEDFIFTNNVEVVVAICDFLKQQNGVERIVILGHSEGSTVGMLAAQKVEVYKYISLAGPGYPADEVLRKQLKTLPDEMRADAFGILDTLKMGKPVTKFNPQLVSLFRPTMNKYMIDWFRYDPRIEIAKLKMPVLVIQGDNDIQVSVDNADALANANKKARKVLVKDVNHVLKVAPKDFQENYKTYNSPDVDIAERIKKALVDFILL